MRDKIGVELAQIGFGTAENGLERPEVGVSGLGV